MSISLEAALNTCKVNTGWATKVQSDRFLNPNNMVCPIWNGMDVTGRVVAPDSFYTKRAGCNSAEDRIVVENNVSRPQYIEYINLNASGVDGDIYGKSMGQANVQSQAAAVDQAHQYTGQFGLQTGFDQNIRGNCNVDYNNGKFINSREQALAQSAQARRQGQFANNSYYGNHYRGCSGS
jgi:hypothetical protein